jgi:HAD superfamily hydrolase (TIGR01509 family)
MAQQSRFRAVLFDVDGTLYSQVPLRIAMACEMGLLAASPLPARRRQIRRVLRFRRVREALRTGSRTGALAQLQYSEVSRQMDCSVDEVKGAVQEWIYDRPLKWVPFCRRRGLRPLLNHLRSQGVQCGVFSDYPAADKLTALGLRGFFDVVLSATDPDVDAFKPDPRGFLAAAARWGLPASQILYVGDRVDVDAAGAAAAGMPCAVLTKRKPYNGAPFIPIRHFKELQSVLSGTV